MREVRRMREIGRMREVGRMREDGEEGGREEGGGRWEGWGRCGGWRRMREVCSAFICFSLDYMSAGERVNFVNLYFDAVIKVKVIGLNEITLLCCIMASHLLNLN